MADYSPNSVNNNATSQKHCLARLSPRQWLAILALCLGCAAMAALLATNSSHFGGRKMSNQEQKQHNFKSFINERQDVDVNEIREAIFANIDPVRIASTLREVTKEPHVGGTEANKRVADRIAKLWKENGVEKVQMQEYDVLLSYPNWTTPNHVTIFAEDGDVLFQSTGLSPDLIPPIGGGNDLRASIQWLAYSANGTVEGEPVYCHYGRPQDFERLEREFGIASLEGKIAVIRYGQDFRGDKVKHAQQRGADAVILFSDPMEVAGEGQDAESTFPHTDWLPGQGVQRGSCLFKASGDPLTPLLPSKKEFTRSRNIEQAKSDGILPKIPVLPLGYADAAKLLSRIGGPKAPNDWQGGLKLPYHIGPGFAHGKGAKLRVDVHAELKIKTIQNVIGMIRGQEEPDSWVMLGNHYDAWVFGSLDPNSGTAILGEVARAFADTVRNKQWRPKRSIVFCAWDSEEYGLIGSTEFVQEFAELLRDRAVVYLNLDLISSNQSLEVRAVPSLFQMVTDAARVVPNPVKSEKAMGRPTMFETWKTYIPPKTSWLPDWPHVYLPGGNSDHMSFLNFLGIPVVDFKYRNASWKGYPLYHSRYEVPFVNEHLFDHDNLSVHVGVGKYWAEMARSFADSPILPINATLVGQQMLKEYLADARREINSLSAKYPAELAPAVKQLNSLERQTHAFMAQTYAFGTHMQTVEPSWANRRLRKLEQCFLNPAMGLARTEPEKLHVLFSMSDDDTYSASVMTAVNHKISQLKTEKDATKRADLGKQLALELTVVQNGVLCATNILKPFI